MPEKELGGLGGDNQDEEAFDYGQSLDISKNDTQESPEMADYWARMRLLHEEVRKAKNIDEVVVALYKSEKNEIAQNILDVMERAEKLFLERPETSQYAIEEVLENSDIFKNEAFKTGYSYLDKKIRKTLVEHLKGKLLTQ